jgi:hypothetical protein
MVASQGRSQCCSTGDRPHPTVPPRAAWHQPGAGVVAMAGGAAADNLAARRLHLYRRRAPRLLTNETLSSEPKTLNRPNKSKS